MIDKVGDTVLTVEAGQFVLNGKQGNVGDSELWSRENGKYVTKSYQAAAKVKHLADEKAQKILDRVLQKRYLAPSRPLPDFLDAHQKEGVNWILTRSRSYLAHAPGAGKTVEAIVASVLAGKSNTEQTIVIVPPDLTENWAREIVRFLTLMKEPNAKFSFAIVPRTQRQSRMDWTKPYIIVPDSMLTRPWVERALKEITDIFTLKMLIVDEGSRFKEPLSRRSIVLFGGKTGQVTHTGLFRKARHAVLMDGSPMPNRAIELWAPTFAFCPEAIDFMSELQFGFKYCEGRQDDMGRWYFPGTKLNGDLKKKLTENFMHIVTEEELDHSERHRAMLYMSRGVRSYELQKWEAKNLSQIDWSDIDEDISTKGDIARFRRMLGIQKAPWVAEYVKRRLENKKESIIVYAWHREVCESIAKRLAAFKPALIIGGVPNSYREKAFKSFQSGETQVIVANIAAMARGHNLQRADRIIFGEFSWTDELNRQCEKRASRRGRDKNLPVMCDYIVAPDSMDEVVLKSVFNKARAVKSVIG